MFCQHTHAPALRKDVQHERDNAITSYFQQGFSNAKIAGFMALQHGIILSVRTVKRILKRLRLKRAGCNNESPLEEIVSVILEELVDSFGTFMDYRQLTRLLRRKCNLQVRRDTIMECLRTIDPEGVDGVEKDVGLRDGGMSIPV